MWAVRIVRMLRSRKKHALASTTQSVTVVRDGVSESIDIPIDRYPLLLHFPGFPPPRFFTGDPSPGISVSRVFSVLFGPSSEDVLRALGGQEITITSPPDHAIAFARMLAKIGYALAVADGHEYALDGRAFVLPAILGERDDIGQWVGTHTDPIRKYPDLLHHMAIRKDFERGLLMAEIQLFSDSETPRYGVILGRLRR